MIDNVLERNPQMSIVRKENEAPPGFNPHFYAKD